MNAPTSPRRVTFEFLHELSTEGEGMIVDEIWELVRANGGYDQMASSGPADDDVSTPDPEDAR